MVMVGVGGWLGGRSCCPLRGSVGGSPCASGVLLAASSGCCSGLELTTASGACTFVGTVMAEVALVDGVDELAKAMASSAAKAQGGAGSTSCSMASKRWSKGSLVGGDAEGSRSGLIEAGIAVAAGPRCDVSKGAGACSGWPSRWYASGCLGAACGRGLGCGGCGIRCSAAEQVLGGEKSPAVPSLVALMIWFQALWNQARSSLTVTEAASQYLVKKRVHTECSRRRGYPLLWACVRMPATASWKRSSLL